MRDRGFESFFLHRRVGCEPDSTNRSTTLIKRLSSTEEALTILVCFGHRRRVREKQGAGGIRVLASAAPGTDIICHELCRELDLKSTICLPMPVDSYSTNIFKDLDGWRSRFLALVGEGADRLQLSDAAGLPKWLQGTGTGTDEWERGNRWVLQLALSAGAPKVSLIAVWDGDAVGDAKGGTAHMVQIARAAGTVHVEVIALKDGAVVAAGP